MSGSDPRRALGAAGERLARTHLEARGLTVLDTNFRTRHGELDIVAADARCLVFCEVKTRIGRRAGAPERARPVRRDRPAQAAHAAPARARVAGPPRRRRALAPRAALRRRRGRARSAGTAASNRPPGGRLLTRMQACPRGEGLGAGRRRRSRAGATGERARAPELADHRRSSRSATPTSPARPAAGRATASTPAGNRDGTDRAAYNCTAATCSYDHGPGLRR